MSFLSDLLLAGGAFGAALFCLILSRRLKALTALDSGMGAAVAVLSAQVDDLAKAIRRAQDAAEGSAGRLSAQTVRAEAACRRLELLVAALHDLPGEGAAPAAPGSGDTPIPQPEAQPTPLRSRILRRRAAERAA